MSAAAYGSKPSYKLPKSKQKLGDLTDFQKALSANPYARALASPVRQCAVTAAKLPSAFLLPFVTEFRPQQLSKNAAKDEKKDGVRLIPHLLPREGTSSVGPGVYLVNSMALLSRLSKKGGWHRLASREMGDKYKIRDKKDWVWDSATDQQVLRVLRNQILTKLKWGFKMPNAMLVRPLGTSPSPRHVACVLILRPRTASGDSPEVEAAGRQPTDAYGTEDTIPRFDLHELLGEEALATLVDDTQFAKSEAVTLASSYLTASTHVGLLRLQAFLDH
ncbi:hypothetical protein MBLNU459_g2028t1 [Dothideomycetes sp. NU459]